jgi:hypothetical protein
LQQGLARGAAVVIDGVDTYLHFQLQGLGVGEWATCRRAMLHKDGHEWVMLRYCGILLEL